MKYPLNGRVVIVGFGSIGQAILPLFLKTFSIDPNRITIVTADQNGQKVAAEFGVNFHIKPITPQNYQQVLENFLSDGDWLLNLSVSVSSAALIEWCYCKNVFYLDTCIEPWDGLYTDDKLPLSARSNYALREEILSVKEKCPNGPTAVVAHGANPGLVSHFLKAALLQLADDQGIQANPNSRQDWAKLAYDLGVRVVHISEYDTQRSVHHRKREEFVNTWSIDGLINEGLQPAELGWGTHEKKLPNDAKKHVEGSKASIYLEQPGLQTRVRTWAPDAGAFQGFLITHNESISIADYFSFHQEDGIYYRPTVHYSYRPSDDTVVSIHAMQGNNFVAPAEKRLLGEDIADGMDELGVLLMGHKNCAYWYGSQLTIQETRKFLEKSNATSLQVVAGILGALVWMTQNPRAGIVEAEEVDHNVVLEVAKPYLGKLVGVYSDWTPLQNRSPLFNEEIDMSDPWQFTNFRIT